MAALDNLPMRAGTLSMRWPRAIGSGGALLALAILGTSMLLRLATFFGADGQVISTLPPSIEGTARLIHRLAATGVGLLAASAAILCWVRRPLPSQVVKPIAWIAAATVFLALIGPLTPGYRVAAITVGNVVGGMVLLMAFWWLREWGSGDAPAGQAVVPRDIPSDKPLLRATLFVFLSHVALGAAASANEMHGVRGSTLLHLGTALLSTLFVGATLWARRREPTLAGRIAATTCLMAAQLALGFALMWLGTRPLWLAFMHGMLSPLLAIALVSLAIRDARRA